MVGIRRWLGLFVVAAISTSAAAEDITSNLLGNWKLTETSGTTAVDSASTPHNGTYTNGVLLANSTANPVDGAISANFDGANDYVAIGSESYFDITGAITVAAWIKVDVFDVAYQAIVTKGDSAWRLQRNNATNGVMFACTGLSTVSVTSIASVNDGKWHHVVGQYTGTYLILYIDGVLDNYVASFGSIALNNFNVEIARNAQVAGREFDGAIYDARVYNRALSGAEVSYLALQGGPVGQWKLSETSGTTATDSSIFGKNGTVFGGASWSTRCNGVGVYDFNGGTQYISIANASNLQPWLALTITGWVKGDSWGAGTDVDTILRKGEGNPNNYSLQISDGRVELLLDGNDGAGIRSNAVLSTGQWYHVAATWDGSTAKIYINGVLDNTVSHPAFLATDIRALYIGGRSGADLFNGMIQEVCLYNRALSQAEIARAAGLAGGWKFSEGTGTTATDSSGAGNNATLSGGAAWTTDCAGNNNALLTNGTGGIAQTASAFNPPDVGTLAFWMRSNGNPSVRQRILGLGGDWEVRYEVDGTLAFDLCGEAGTDFVTTAPLNQANRWYHVAATFNSATKAYAVYVDGLLQKSGTNTNAMTQQTAAVLSFGTRTGNTEYWQGALRDVRVYSRLLCPVEIAELYGLVGYWKLNETIGTTATDSSGQGYNGTVTGTVNWTAAKMANGFQFDYTNGEDYITLPSTTTLDDVQEGNYTLSAWFKPLSTPPGTGSANNANYGILVKAGWHGGLSYSHANQFEFGHYLTGNVWHGTGTWSNTYPPGVWHHVVAVVNRTAGTITLYLDNVVKGTDSFTANTSAREYNAEPWRIGIALPNDTTWGWAAHGVADDVRIYNRALCPAEVQDVYQSGNPFGGVKITKWVEIQ